jgi:transcriptional regulator with XRE-family HTH domain
MSDATVTTDFGSYVREKRERLGENAPSSGRAPQYSLRAVARSLGIEASYLSKVERGVMPAPSNETIQHLAEVLEEDYDTLMLLAGRVSPQLQAVVSKRPRLFAELIRELSEAPDAAIFKLVREVRDGQW